MDHEKMLKGLREEVEICMCAVGLEECADLYGIDLNEYVEGDTFKKRAFIDACVSVEMNNCYS
jgi:hypothetical protein